MKRMTPAMLLKALKMFRGFTKAATQYLRDKERLRHLLAKAVSIAQRRGGKLLKDIQLLVRLLKASMSGVYTGLSVRKLVAIVIVAAILYLISPLDVIPDFIPVVGYVDDAAVIAWVMKSIAEELKDFKIWEEGT
ncbi:MAG: DUF1232 domain-containing protein [Nitrospirota bacterium]|nr:DUF1232 domain-containing protein [Nitrospirota bacterium]